jgi:glutaredoxin
MAKEYFKKHDVAYTEHDVASDLAARKDMFDKSHQMGVPVIDIGGTIIVGFDQRAIDQALGAKN